MRQLCRLSDSLANLFLHFPNPTNTFLYRSVPGVMATGEVCSLIGCVSWDHPLPFAVRSAEWTLLFKGPTRPVHGLLLFSRFVFAFWLNLLVREEKTAAGIIYVPLQGRRGHNLTNVWGQLVRTAFCCVPCAEVASGGRVLLSCVLR